MTGLRKGERIFLTLYAPMRIFTECMERATDQYSEERKDYCFCNNLSLELPLSGG